jgi:hypothetical protein
MTAIIEARGPIKRYGDVDALAGTAYWVALSLVWCTGILAVFSAFAVARFARTR